MWIFTETGFVSAVVSNQDPTKMMVRARDKKSLMDLSTLSGEDILEIPNRDYPYRVITDKKTLKTWMAGMIDIAEYSNFKSRVSVTRGGEFVRALHDVWAVMHDVTDTAKAKKNSLYYDYK